MFEPKNILVTGSAGFIGSHFVKMILSQNPHVRVVSYDALTYAGSLDRLASLEGDGRHVFVHGDIRDPVLIKKVMVQYAIDAIVHFAAESHVDQSIEGPRIFIETNVLGTFHLLETARQYWLEQQGWGVNQCRFHHISTDEVFGSLASEDAGFTEQTSYQPNSPYSASKAGSDHLVRAYHHTYGLPVTLSNCSNNFGPDQHDEKWIPVIIRACLVRQPIPVYGTGRHVRDWLYVVDHCDAIMKILMAGQVGETYNIGGGYELDNVTLAKKICGIMDALFPEVAHAQGAHERLIHFVADRKGHDFRYAIDGRKIQNDLGWQPSQCFEQQLKETVACYCAAHAQAMA